MTVVRYPLTPGRPRVYRRAPGAWAFECHCAPVGRSGRINQAMPNLPTHARAMWHALDHVRYAHVDPLERLYALAAYDRGIEERPRCQHCGMPHALDGWPAEVCRRVRAYGGVYADSKPDPGEENDR